MQQTLFQTIAPPAASQVAGAPEAALRRWWRLHGQARRCGRAVEPVLVTPRFLARIAAASCPVTRTPLAPHAAVVLPLRDDASVAAGHLVTVDAAAAAAAAGRDWAACRAIALQLQAQPGARQAGLDAGQWQRLALLRSFVQPLTPAQAATLPLHALPPHRLRVLSPVQGLQVAITLALAAPRRAERLCRLAALATDEDTRMALRVLVLTLLARCPAGLDTLAPTARRQVLEDLWADPLLVRRWQRLALRLTDAGADRLLAQGRRQGCLVGPWRRLDDAAAVDGWDLRPGPERRLESRHELRDAPRLAAAVLGTGDRRQRADAAAASAAGG